MTAVLAQDEIAPLVDLGPWRRAQYQRVVGRLSIDAVAEEKVGMRTPAFIRL